MATRPARRFSRSNKRPYHVAGHIWTGRNALCNTPPQPVRNARVNRVTASRKARRSSIALAASVILALLTWTSACVADPVCLAAPASTHAGAHHDPVAPAKQDPCCSQFNKLTATSDKPLVRMGSVTPHPSGIPQPAVLPLIARVAPASIFRPARSPDWPGSPWLINTWPNAPPV